MIRYYRPEDVDPSLALTADFWEVYAGDKETTLFASSIVGKCMVVGKGQQTGWV